MDKIILDGLMEFPDNFALLKNAYELKTVETEYERHANKISNVMGFYFLQV